MNAIVFDWDGTLVSCEEKIDATIQQICWNFPKIQDAYRVAISNHVVSPGWARKGLIASLPEDYFTYHFGIVADLLAKSKESVVFTNDTAWSLILSKFRRLYGETPSRLLADRKLLAILAEQTKLYIVSNSDGGNIRNEAQSFGIDDSLFTFIGNAKKYHVESSEPSILGIPVKRPLYQKVLLSLLKKHQTDIIVVGDNFSLDLAEPFFMGIRVAYIPNPLSPEIITDFIKSQHIFSGSINQILETLIRKKKGGIV
jgi:phosphoglycolate phosphatase-like HAD superfamily hydrolase